MALIRVPALEDHSSPLTLKLVLLAFLLVASILPSSAYAQTSFQHAVLTYSSRSIAPMDFFVRSRAKANRYFQHNERGSTDGMPTHEEITEYLKEAARILGLAAPLPAMRGFDFGLQREANQELGTR